MEDYEEKGEELEGRAEDMERRSERLEGEIGEAERDWKTKKQDAAVPGAVPEEAEDEASGEDGE